MRGLAMCVAAALVLAAPAAIAAGSGGGGGGGMPSSSAPSYDPAKEYQAGVAALKLNDFRAAKKAFERVVEAAPREAVAHYLLGVSRAGLEDYKGARRAYERAIKLKDDLVGARKDLALASVKLAEPQVAQTQLADLKARLAACAGACAQAQELAEAVKAIEAALAAPPVKQSRLDPQRPLFFASAEQGDGAYLEAIGLINEGRYEAALASLETARAAFGAHPDVLTYIGFANRKLQRFEVAEDYYQQALAIAPNHRGALEYFGELHVERGDLPGARAMLSRLEKACAFGCAEAEELRRWIDAAPASRS